MGRNRPPKNTTKDTSVPIPKEQLRDLFKSCDTNGYGKLSKTELKTAFKKLGAPIPRFRAHQGMVKGDANKDGFIELDDKELEDVIEYALSLGYKVNN